MLTFIKFVVGVPFVAICLLLIIGIGFSIYAVKNRNKEYAEYIENLGKKKKDYSKKANATVIIDDYRDFVNKSLSTYGESYSKPLNPQKEASKRKKKAKNRKRRRIAKKSRQQNR